MKRITFLLLILMLCLISSVAFATEFTDGPRARNDMTRQVKAMFNERKFAELDAMAEQFRTKKSRFTDGVWKLQVFYMTFELATNSPEWKFPNQLTLAEEWRKTRPKSVTAQCVLASTWSAYAWKARGGGFAREVKEDEWSLVRKRLDKAWEIINQPLAPGVNDCPIRHNLRLVLAKTRGVPPDEFEALFQEAVQFAPGYYHYYANKADYLLPKWHGEEGDWQRFISAVAESNPNREGKTIYTRTAWSLFLSNEWKDFEASGVTWARLKAGFEEIDRNYPNSPWILNTFTKFACRAGDRDTVVALFNRMGWEQFYQEAWESENVDACRLWAGLPTFDELTKKQLAENMRKMQERVFKEKSVMAENGNRQAMTDLGIMYLTGEGTTLDLVTGYAWLAQDEPTNQTQLRITTKSLSPEQLQKAKLKANEIRRRTPPQPDPL